MTDKAKACTKSDVCGRNYSRGPGNTNEGNFQGPRTNKRWRDAKGYANRNAGTRFRHGAHEDGVRRLWKFHRGNDAKERSSKASWAVLETVITSSRTLG